MTGTIDPTVINLVVFVLAVFVGYHVIWNVTPAPRTSTRAAFTVPAAVISMGMKRPYSAAARITAL